MVVNFPTVIFKHRFDIGKNCSAKQKWRKGKDQVNGGYIKNIDHKI